jgi:hypothetical protein
MDQRLLNQHIAGEKFERPEEVVSWMGAMQAQDYGQAVWAVGLRTRRGTLADVEQAISEGKIVRTWPMRGTLHFVAPEDAKWIMQITADQRLRADRRRQEQLDLDAAVLDRSCQVFYDALHGGRRATRPEMMSLLENAGIPAVSQRGYHILWYASLNGLICLGPMQGKQQTFVLLDEWAPGARAISGDEALAELARRYFTSHGPALVQDFAWWAGLTLGKARSGVAAAGAALLSETLDGKEYWLARDALPVSMPDRGCVYLLPGFDEYLLGYTDRSRVLPQEQAPKIVPGANGVFRPMVVVDGQVVGTWKRTAKKKGVEIRAELFSPRPALEEGLRAEAQRYSEFLGLPLASFDLEK